MAFSEMKYFVADKQGWYGSKRCFCVFVRRTNDKKV